MDFISKHIKTQFLTSKDDKKLQIQLFLFATFVFAALAHIVLLAYFFYVRDLFYLRVSLSGLPLILVLFFVNRAGKIRAASLMYVLLLLFNSFRAKYYFGTEAGAHWKIGRAHV